MKVKVVVPEAEGSAYWADVPPIPGCAMQGEAFEQLLENLCEVVEGRLYVDLEKIKIGKTDRLLELAV